VPPDFYLIVAAVAIAYGATWWFRARFARDERRRRRTISHVPLARIAAATPGQRVRIVGRVARVVERARVRGFVIADDSGDAFVYSGAAALLDRKQHPAAGDSVTVVGVARSVDRRFDHDIGGATLVFAGGEADPLYIV
jgi:DNA-binding IclR family transcriptional regulator